MNHKILSDNFLINGMPCHKYILRQLATTIDAVTFTKTYVNTMIATGASYDEVEASLPLLSFRLDSNSPVAGHNFASCENSLQGLSLIDAIRLDDNVPTFRKCDTFYKKFDPKRIACRLCPLSTKYLNRQLSLEKSIISYALSSPDAFRYVQEQGISSEHFQSVIDIMGYFSYANKPSCYPLYSQTFVALQDETIRIDFFTSMEQGKTSRELISYHDACLTNSYIPRGLISSELMRKLGEVIYDELLSGIVPVANKIDLLILSLMNPDLDECAYPKINSKTNIGASNVHQKRVQQTEKNHTQIAENTNLGIDTLEEFFPANARKYSVVDDHVQQKEMASPSSTFYNENYEPVTLNDLLANMELTKADTSLIATTQIPPDSLATAPSRGAITVHGSNISAVAEAEIVEKLLGKSTNHTPVPDKEILLHEIGTRPASVESIYYETTRKSMIGIPVVLAAELQHFALNLDLENIRLLSMFESYVTKDQKLSIELIRTDAKEIFLLLYSPRMRTYFYTSMGNTTVKNLLVPLLEHTSIRKYCYYPFTVLGSLWKMGIYAKGVFSLFSISSLLYGNHQLDMPAALEKMGATPAIGGVTIKPTGIITSIPLMYLHSFTNLYHRKRYELVRRGFIHELEERNNFDRILGYSYYQNRYFTDRTVLFTLTSCNRYLFQSRHANLRPGHMTLTYTFNNPHGITNHIIKGIISVLDATGRLRKFRMAIVSISSNSFSLCIQEKDHHVLKTLLNTTILSYLHSNNLSEIEYFLE